MTQVAIIEDLIWDADIDFWRDPSMWRVYSKMTRWPGAPCPDRVTYDPARSRYVVADERGRIRDAHALHWVTFDRQGNVVELGQGLCAPTTEEMGRWGRAVCLVAAGMRAGEEALLRQPLYIRLGRIPHGGRSFNYRDRHAERGLSCYRARYNPLYHSVQYDENEQVDPSVALCDTYSGAPRTAYLMTGTTVEGRGSDGEPLLDVAHSTVLGTLRWQVGRHGYVLRRRRP